MAKRKSRSKLDPGLAKLMKATWTRARQQVRKKYTDRDLRRETLVHLAQQHLELAKEHLAIGKFFMSNAE